MKPLKQIKSVVDLKATILDEAQYHLSCKLALKLGTWDYIKLLREAEKFAIEVNRMQTVWGLAKFLKTTEVELVERYGKY